MSDSVQNEPRQEPDLGTSADAAPDLQAKGAGDASAGEEFAAGIVGTPDQLRAARESLKLSVTEVAGKLRMSPRQIEALELGNWDSLPGLAFVRGAIRSYGRLLEQDVSALLESVGGFSAPGASTLARQSRAALPRATDPGFGKSSSRGRWVWAVLGAAGVIGIAVFFSRPGEVSMLRGWLASIDGRADGTPSSSTPVQSDEPARAGGQPGSAPGIVPGASSGATVAGNAGASAGGAEPAVARPSPAAAAGTGIQPAGGDGSVSTGRGPQPIAPASPGAPTSPGATPAGPAAGSPPESRGTGDALPTAAPPAPVAAAPAPQTPPVVPPALRFSFSRESWIEIRDANGKVLATGTQQPGTTLVVDGVAPFALIVGNAGSVRLERSGKPIDLARGSREGVARLKIE